MWAPFCMAEKVGKGMGRSEILQRKVQKGKIRHYVRNDIRNCHFSYYFRMKPKKKTFYFGMESKIIRKSGFFGALVTKISLFLEKHN